MLRDLKNLWRIETYSDPEAGDLVHYVPVTLEGALDLTRESYFIGKVSLTVPGMPPINIGFRIDVKNLPAALHAWPDALKTAVETFDSQRRRAQLMEGISGRG